MAEKMDINLTLTTNQLSVNRNNKSVIGAQKVAPVNLSTIEEQLEKRSISPDQGGYNPHPAAGSYSKSSLSSR